MVDSHGAVVSVAEVNFIPPLMIDGAFNMEILYALLAAALGLAVVIFIERVVAKRGA